MKRIPALLIVIRIVLGPCLFLVCTRFGYHAWILPILLASMFSDIFDGVIARKLKSVTASLRVADSWADAWFFLWIGLGSWLTVRSILVSFTVPLLIEVAVQVSSYAFDLIKYGRLATFHAYTAKAWGFSLYLAGIGLLVFHTGAFVWPSFALGLLSALDALIIKLVLPEWRHDVLSCFHSIRSRRAASVDGNSNLSVFHP